MVFIKILYITSKTHFCISNWTYPHHTLHSTHIIVFNFSCYSCSYFQFRNVLFTQEKPRKSWVTLPQLCLFCCSCCVHHWSKTLKWMLLPKCGDWWKSNRINIYVIYTLVFDRPGVAGAVLKTALCLTLSHPLWKYLQNTVSQKPLELGTLNFRECSPNQVACVKCHISHVTHQVSRVRCQVSNVNF